MRDVEVSRSLKSHILLEMSLEYFVFLSFCNNVLREIWSILLIITEPLRHWQPFWWDCPALLVELNEQNQAHWDSVGLYKINLFKSISRNKMGKEEHWRTQILSAYPSLLEIPTYAIYTWRHIRPCPFTLTCIICLRNVTPNLKTTTTGFGIKNTYLFLKYLKSNKHIHFEKKNNTFTIGI